MIIMQEHCNINPNNPLLDWNLNKLSTFKYWTKLDFSTVADCKRDSNIYGGDINLQTNQWIYELLHTSSNIDLCACVNNTH